ncbi:MAG: MTH1187 family thiamine-binding protein [Candidatus Kapabacteria bacterium]|nr:MTH1187 family thiamine-binding protein [Candidatus Kapabacteria bacterium]
MVLAEFSMFPTDKGESVSAYVSQVINEIDKSGLNYKLTPMGTVLEGSWDEVMGLITRCFKILEPQANRIYSTIKIDYRKTDKSRMSSKIEKIESILNKEIKK